MWQSSLPAGTPWPREADSTVREIIVKGELFCFSADLSEIWQASHGQPCHSLQQISAQSEHFHIFTSTGNGAGGPGVAELAAGTGAWPQRARCTARVITVKGKLFCFWADLDEISQQPPRGHWPGLQ